MKFAQELPDNRGRFGDFGGRFVPETLMPAVHELEVAYMKSKYDEQFQSESENFHLWFLRSKSICCATSESAQISIFETKKNYKQLFTT